MPFFSVIIPTYNRAHLITGAISSVIVQSFGDWELLVIDDGSTDNTADIVSSFNDIRIKYFYQQNTERSAARNKGISKANGRFVCFLDSDDVWLPHHLQTMFDAVKKNDFKPALYFTVMRWCYDDGRRMDVLLPSPENQNPVEYVIKNQVGPPSQCLPREILQKHKFNTSLRVNEDVELNTRITNEYPLVQIPEVTLEIFIHAASTKFQFKEYITPQVEAMELIFANPELKGKISRRFKRKIQLSFDSQYIMVWEQLGETKKMNRAILRYLFRYPFDPKNKARIVLLLYSMPLGNYFQRFVGFLKSIAGNK